MPRPLSQKQLQEIANQSFVSEANQKAFGVDKIEDVPFKPTKGIVTSDEASSRFKSANETINKIQKGIDNLPVNQGKAPSNNNPERESSSNPFAGLFERINILQSNLNVARENEQKAKDALTNQDLQGKLNSLSSSRESNIRSDIDAGADAINSSQQGQPVDTNTIEDPVIRALTEKTVANVGIMNQQMQALSDYRQQFNEYTQQDIDSIARTAERAVNRRVAENDRVKRAMEFAGVLGGRAQFSPIIEESIINDVIQEGLDKIEVINENKNTAIREARKAEADFNIDIFEQQANLAKEFNNEIESTISKMNAQVRQVEKDEREKLEFRQAQEERSSILLADQLIEATPEQIMQTAVANGIDPALLTKAVNEARFAQDEREFTEKDRSLSLKDKELSLEQRRASINKTNNDIRLANAKSIREEGEKIDIPKDVEQGFRSVARLSKKQSESAWQDIQNLGLGNATIEWLEGGLSKSQVKSIVSAHEQSQQVKDEFGVLQSTETETALTTFIDGWEPNRPPIIQEARFKGDKNFSTTSFFKKEPKFGGDTISAPK